MDANPPDKKWEVADILNRYMDTYCQTMTPSPDQLEAMNMIRSCRTAVLGGHLEQCDHCDHEINAYNSCRNRHCPKCQTAKKEKWLEDRKADLLPCGYFHLVFTLPHALNAIIRCNMSVTLDLLFKIVNMILSAFGKDPAWRLNGQMGYIAVLHTWSQTLIDHFHLHCLIPDGALSFDKTSWNPSRKRYLFGVKSLAKEFKKQYLNALENAFAKGKLIFPGKTSQFQSPEAFNQLLNQLADKSWIVYAKRPFAGPEHLLEYLGRYTHRVAISNHRIISVENGRVTFKYKDRKTDGKTRTMTLDACEFIRRFLLHVLPKGFSKIRYFGFLSNGNKKTAIPLIRKLIDPHGVVPEKRHETIAEMMLRTTGIRIGLCPICQAGQMRRIRAIPKIKSNALKKSTVFHDTS